MFEGYTFLLPSSSYLKNAHGNEPLFFESLFYIIHFLCPYYCLYHLHRINFLLLNRYISQ